MFYVDTTCKIEMAQPIVHLPRKVVTLYLALWRLDEVAHAVERCTTNSSKFEGIIGAEIRISSCSSCELRGREVRPLCGVKTD